MTKFAPRRPPGKAGRGGPAGGVRTGKACARIQRAAALRCTRQRTPEKGTPAPAGKTGAQACRAEAGASGARGSIRRPAAEAPPPQTPQRRPQKAVRRGPAAESRITDKPGLPQTSGRPGFGLSETTDFHGAARNDTQTRRPLLVFLTCLKTSSKRFSASSMISGVSAREVYRRLPARVTMPLAM